MEPTTDRNSFADIMDSWTTRPGMWRINRVEDIELLITGYRFGIQNENEMRWFDGFREFVNKKYHFKKDADWPSLIRFSAGGSDLRTVEAFRELLVDYCHKEKVVLPSLAAK